MTTQWRSALLSDKDAAKLLGIGERSFNDLIGAEWMPKPIVFGPRLRRWDADELLEAVRKRAPRADNKPPMPAQLKKARGL